MDAARELEALWLDVFGQPPFIRAEAQVLAGVLVASLPPAPPYTPDVVERRGEEARRTAPYILRDPFRRL